MGFHKIFCCPVTWKYTCIANVHKLFFYSNLNRDTVFPFTMYQCIVYRLSYCCPFQFSINNQSQLITQFLNYTLINISQECTFNNQKTLIIRLNFRNIELKFLLCETGNKEYAIQILLNRMAYSL